MFCQVHLNSTSLRRGLFSFVVLNVSLTVVSSKQVSRDQAVLTSYHEVYSVFTEFSAVMTHQLGDHMVVEAIFALRDSGHSLW